MGKGPKPPKKGLMTATEYARHRGVSYTVVMDAIRADHITCLKQEGRTWIDPKQADQEWMENRGTRSEGKTADYAKARAQREQANAEKAQLQLEEYKGTLIKRADVEKQGFETGRKIRAALESLPGRISAKFASKTDPHECEILLRKEIEAMLLELTEIEGCDDIEAELGAADGGAG